MRQKVYIIAEIGINHNGSLEIAKKLISIAKECGADAVKFQKREIDKVYTKEELLLPRDSPFGSTNGDLKKALEFSRSEYLEIDSYCKKNKIDWFASCWDVNSVDFINEFDVPYHKVASALLTDKALLERIKESKKKIILSTGMSTMEEIDTAVKFIGEKDLCIMHSTSTYPADYRELNLNMIKTLTNTYTCDIGYSGHETGVSTSVAAVALGARYIERHITLDRSMYGTDQAASLGPNGFRQLCRDIRILEEALGDGIKKVYDSELPVLNKLRKVK